MFSKCVSAIITSADVVKLILGSIQVRSIIANYDAVIKSRSDALHNASRIANINKEVQLVGIGLARHHTTTLDNDKITHHKLEANASVIQATRADVRTIETSLKTVDHKVRTVATSSCLSGRDQ